jgi:hypothetical protein
MRGRISLAFTLGLVGYLIWETFKRLHLLVSGLVHFLVGGKPTFAWKEAFAPHLSAYIENVLCSDDYEPMMKYSGWKNLYRPIFPISALVIVTLLVMWPDFRMYLLATVILVIALFVFASIAAILMYGTAKIFKFFNLTKKQRAAQVFDRIEHNAVCGMNTTPPKASVTVRLVWTGIKSRVCRPYG